MRWDPEKKMSDIKQALTTDKYFISDTYPTGVLSFVESFDFGCWATLIYVLVLHLRNCH